MLLLSLGFRVYKENDCCAYNLFNGLEDAQMPYSTVQCGVGNRNKKEIEFIKGDTFRSPALSLFVTLFSKVSRHWSLPPSRANEQENQRRAGIIHKLNNICAVIGACQVSASCPPQKHLKNTQKKTQTNPQHLCTGKPRHVLMLFWISLCIRNCGAHAFRIFIPCKMHF